jgi:hypothetical protein
MPKKGEELDMNDRTEERTRSKSRRYQFLIAPTLLALEDEVNRLVSDDPYLQVIQILSAVGTGFVAVVERPPSSPPLPSD